MAQNKIDVPFPLFSAGFQQVLDDLIGREIARVERIMHPPYTITFYKGLYALDVEGCRLRHFYRSPSAARSVAERYLRMKAVSRGF